MPVECPDFELDVIHNEDCLVGLQQMPDKCVDLVVTDPPYLFSSTTGGGAFGSKNREYHSQLAPMADGFSEKVLEECLRVLKAPNLYVFCSTRQISTLLAFAEVHELSYDLLAWHKTNPTPLCGNKYLSDTEYIVFMRGKGVKLYGTYATKHKSFYTPVNVADKKTYGHPTCKPVHILETLIGNSSQPGDVVLDPYIGSGSTAVAAQNLDRKYIGFEIDANYCKVASTRLALNKQTNIDNDR